MAKTPTARAMSNIQNRRLAPMIDRIIADNLPAQALSRCHSALKNRGTKLPPCHLLPVGTSRVSMLGAFLRRSGVALSIPRSLSPALLPSSVHSPLRPSSHIQLSQRTLIYRGTYAHATPCGWILMTFFCFHEPDFRKESRSFRLLSRVCRQRSSLWCVISAS